MLFCLWTRVGSSNQVLGVGQIPRRNGQFWGLFHSLKCTKLCKQQTPQQPGAAQLCTLVILLAFSLLRDFRLTTIRTRSGEKVPEWFFPVFSAPFPSSPLWLLPCPSLPTFLSSLPLEVGFLISSCGVWGSASCILAVKYDILWQQY